MPVTESMQVETHEQQLARLHREVEALRDQLRSAQRLATLGTMTAMVAHEFNNILTPIINYAQLARTNPAMTAKAIARAADGGQRATSICQAILGLARNEHAPATETNVSELIAETLNAMGRKPERDAIELNCRCPEDLTLVTRRVELQQVLLNLLLNGREAVLARSGPRRIEVVAEQCGQCVVIGVRDNGVGIPPENLQRVFEPFFTTRAGAEGQPEGHGLGLAICSDIVAGLGGDIKVDSRPDQGATFIVCLPKEATA